MLYVIAAPSGAGKTTIVRELLKKHPGIVFSVSATTRKKRDNETEGRDYFFYNKDEFRKMIENGELVEHEILFNGDYYGTLKSFVNENIENGKNVIFDIDVNGAVNIKKIYGNKAILIFIMPPDLDTLKERLKKRGTESIEQINERIKRVDLEIGKKNDFDYIVVNDDLQKAVSEVENFLNINN
ncbi:MAG: guanylate kinase [Ignavibacteria bacterium]|jgi:guanylate kinase|nr:guanylate kinase [Ignavibacteria bacterium]